MNIFVADTSVVVKWFQMGAVREEESQEAKAWLQKHLNSEIILAAPELLWYEFGNVLRQKKELSLKDKKKIFHDLTVVELNFYSFNQEHHQNILSLAEEYAVTYYDAAFLGLAKFLGGSLLTADKKFYSKIDNLKNVRLLGAKSVF